jgi:bacillithiol system protein YtxJ
MNWIELSDLEQVDQIIQQSLSKPQLIFKHSTRCSISSMVKDRLERQWKAYLDEFPVYYLDLIRYRSVSNFLSDTFGVIHESPQLLIIKDGKCLFDCSHSDISVSAIEAIIEKQS